MAAQEFYKLKEAEKVEVFTAVAQQKGLPVYAVEKDWWVVQTLDIIFSQLEVAEHLLFKGGTSLSKAWHLIQRFSEDIDLALNREYLGFDGGLISKSQVKKLREKSFEFVTTTFYEALQKAFAEKGYTDVTFDFENLGDGDQDPVSILIYYPAVTEHSEYVLPRVKVELGSRSLKDPFTNCDIISFVGEQFPKQQFADTAINLPCVNPERTYLEKLFLLHEEFKKPNDKIRVERLSRHLYDISKIYNSEHKDKAYDQELIVSIIEHRERFNGMRGVDYATLYPPNLNPIPPDDFIKAWEDDYKTMQTNMIPEDSPSFTDLLETVKKATQEYNALKFE
ncbi:nucleotidyl transferase AbiEii/AbiGii toxin family protein [Mesoflavibacter profundi]|uniref:Nucleotidyl transferase AbiEii/AbiGii toxin family protein n=1 Tax=Mesoflavibacter profundi TaxID=2708110 RepID=A0ABT4RYC9_9FLAO|nr:nucleotidyl transferase AbiEii/AbiGii toxin family protein [Mesoflavibacter profundi]MDA0176824.1 nucleotidyl transferase AbiEii/AbiGii toxin family protein [Mesoflavibacter profundi]